MSASDTVPAVLSTVCATPWCVDHGPEGCLGRAWRVPGTSMIVWLARPPGHEATLTVDGPEVARIEVPVRD